MTEREAFEQLEDTSVISYAQAGLEYCKDMLKKCLDVDIPAMITRPEDSDRVHLLIREQDVEQVSKMFAEEWRDLAEQDGAQFVELTEERGDRDRDGDGDGDGDGEEAAAEGGEDADDDLACPACGTALPLVDGACSDCGLVLE